MTLFFRCFIAAALFTFGAGTPLAQTNSGPRLAIESHPPLPLRVYWTNQASGFALEYANQLTLPMVWRVVPAFPADAGGQFSVSLAPNGSQFFRLHVPVLTRVVGSSPANGEEGVSVLRETVVHISAPLSTNAVVGPQNFYASFGARTLLTRVELSTDRTKASLFYLEPLPGNSRISATFDGAGLTDYLGRPLDPDGDGQPGGALVISFATQKNQPLPGTAIMGTVLASELQVGLDGTKTVDRPLQGVTITVDGMEETARTTTDAQGNFVLSPAPPGQFFVKIDGRTAVGSHWPGGDYYPYVGKLWETVPGVTNNLAGGTGKIYLPFIAQGTLQPVSAIQDTVITFPPSVVSSNPALAGVSITVPANSLFADDGTRGGKVGIAPVPPDRLPGPLPPGATPPLVITVQTDGPLNFDRPAPVCFPNLPDPTTGQVLPPGTKEALISFNHKKGAWEPVGSMTVSSDGRFVCTDPGVGIVQPGWHFPAAPPPPPPPPPPDDPPCGECDCFDCAPSTPLDVRRFALRTVDTAPCQQRCSQDDERLPVAGALAFARALQQCGLSGNLGDWLAGAVMADRINELLRPLRQAICAKQCAFYFTGLKPAVATEVGEASTPPVQATPRASSTSDPALANQIIAGLNSVRDMIYPFAVVHQALPQSVLDKAKAALNDTLALAGGDAAAFLSRYLLALENEAAALEAMAGEALGTTPPYPVLYMAEVLRPSGVVQLRGKTQPYGQYSIFMPRDGVLQYVSFYDPRTKRYGVIYPRLRPSAPYRLPRFYLFPLDSSFPDTDQDGLPDVVEAIYGTDPANPDTDGDGIGDGAAVGLGLDPLGGEQVQTGILATAQTPGNAVDVVVQNDLAVVAESDKGVGIFNMLDPLNPTLVSQVATPAKARSVAIAGSRVAVANDTAGLTVIDISRPAAAQIVQQTNLGGAAVAIAANNVTAYVGLANGNIVQVNMATGTVEDAASAGATVYDLRVSGNLLFVLSDTELSAYGIGDGFLDFKGKVTTTPERADPLTGRKRVFVGDGYALVSCWIGYDWIDVSNLAAMKLVGAASTLGPASFKQIVANGAGLGVAAVGTNPRDTDPTHDINLFDLTRPTVTTNYLTTLLTPGIAYAVTIYHGQAYVADGASGLEVMNYLAYDSKGVPPTISLAPSFSLNPPQMEENKPIFIRAVAKDDVQVRQVDLYLNGTLLASNGSYPFDFYFTAPSISATNRAFTVRAVATDTGGNTTATPDLVVSLTPDVTPPKVIRVTPPAGRVLAMGSTAPVAVTFNEAMNAASIQSGSLRLINAGPDGQFGTADDTAIAGGTVAYDAASKTATFNYTNTLAPGVYQATLSSDVTDVAGNPLGMSYSWSFDVFAAALTQGQPISGAGSFHLPDDEDVYTFTASAGDVVYLDAQSGENCTTRIYWRCVDAQQRVLFDQPLAQTGPCGPQDPGTMVLTNGGKYTVTVYAAQLTTEHYQFQIFKVVPQHFDIAIGQVVSTNSAPGAGAIETPGTSDIYTFQGNRGQRVYFDAQSGDTCGSHLSWRCVDENGGVLFDVPFGATGFCGPRDPGTLVLTNGGTYSITVYGIADATGTYQFQIFDVVPQSFQIAIGEVVNTNTAPGAGEIETPGTSDIYTFQGSPGQTVYFDCQSGDTCGLHLNWRCVDQKGGVLFDLPFGATGFCGPRDPGTLVLTNGGNYTITVYGIEDATGTYQFEIFDVVPQAFQIAIGQVISTNSPPGAGDIETPGAQDIYTFQATPGQVVYFDAQSGENCGSPFKWRCVDEKGAVLFDQVFGATGPCGPTDPGAITLALGGAYTITVYGVQDGTGGYQFQLRSPP